MNICVLFILMNGSMWATDGCWSQGGWMAEPQDVVYTQRLPPIYATQVFSPPPHWANSWRPWARSWRNWGGYRYSQNHHRRWRQHRRWLERQNIQRRSERWNRGYRQGQSAAQKRQRAWNRGYRQGRRAARQQMTRHNSHKRHKKSRRHNRR